MPNDLSHEATSLVLHIDNTEPLNTQMHRIDRAVMRKVVAGKYDRERAIDAYMPLADAAAQDYTREFDKPGGPNGSFGCFDRASRRETAEHYRDYFEMRREAGDLRPIEVLLTPITMSEIRRRNIAAGGTFFDRSHMEHYGERVSDYRVVGVAKVQTRPEAREVLCYICQGRVGMAQVHFDVDTCKVLRPYTTPIRWWKDRV